MRQGMDREKGPHPSADPSPAWVAGSLQPDQHPLPLAQGTASPGSWNKEGAAGEGAAETNVCVCLPLPAP